ncbi:MAG TPA: hypothetical protein VK188_08910 [Holophaga sp.]|nr:hypothetical protein [Holophaga sp.]
MTPDPFPGLPDGSRLWLLPLEAPPAPEASAALAQGLDALMAQWRHKGHAYSGRWALLLGQVVAVAEPDLAGNPSGCAIDGMLRKVSRLLQDLGLAQVDPASHVLADAGGWRAFPKAGLEALLLDGTLGPETPVADLSLFSLGDLRAGRLQAPLARTWIGRRFKVA